MKNNANTLIEKFKKEQKIIGNLKVIKNIKDSQFKDNNSKQSTKYKSITQSKSHILKKKDLMEKKTDIKIHKNFFDKKNFIFYNNEKEGKIILEEKKIIRKINNNISNKNSDKNINKELNENKIIKKKEKNEIKISIKPEIYIEKQNEKNIEKQNKKNVEKQNENIKEKEKEINIEKHDEKNICKPTVLNEIEIRDEANINSPNLIDIKNSNKNLEINNEVNNIKKESNNKKLILEDDKNANFNITNIDNENKNKQNHSPPSSPENINNNANKILINKQIISSKNSSSKSLKKEDSKENIKKNNLKNNNINILINNNDSISNNNKETNIPTNTPENEDPDKFLSIELIETQNIIIGTNQTLNKNSKNDVSFNYSESLKKNYSDFPEMLYEPKNKHKFQNENNNTKSLLTTQSRDCNYYKSEHEKLTNNIKKYFKENKCYPDSNINFYLYGRQIGHGAFGKVNLALHIASGRLVAMKTFIKKELKYKEAKEKIKNEIEVLSKLKHNFINKILDTFETDEYIFIFMEYICGDLLTFIRKRNKLPEKICKMLFKQIIIALKYIHKKNIVHRDIKLDNILIDLNNTIKICDFGVSKKVTKGILMYERCGTPAYIAPEIFIKNGYEGFECDIWSAGVTLYYMLSGTQPFKGKNIHELEKNILTGEFEKIEDVSDEVNDLILGMLQVDPNNRLNCDEILKHPWLKNVNINERFKVNFFSESEKSLLKKYDVDYLNYSNDELIENFTFRNLNIISEKKKIVGNTKSIIYAPYNSCVENSNENDSENSSKNIIGYLNNEKESQEIYDELKVENDICKFGWRTKQPNINYELSNNDDFDNGLMKNKKEVGLMNKNEEANNELRKIKENKESFNSNDCEKVKIDKNLVEYIEKNIGYDKKYLIKCLKKNVVNYCTATYYLLSKDKEGEINEDKDE